MTLRIVHVGKFEPHAQNGVRTALVGLLRNLASADLSIETWHLSRRARDVTSQTIEGIRTITMPRWGHGLLDSVRLPSRTEDEIRERAGQADLVHFHSVYQPVNVRIAQLLPRQTRVVLSPHGGYNAEVRLGRRRALKAIWSRAFEARLLQRVDVLHAVSKEEANELGELRPETRIAYIPNGTIQRPRLNRNHSEWRNEPLLYLGRLAIEYKGLDNLVRGYGLARAGELPIPPLRLVGPDFRGGRNRLEALIRELRLEGDVSIHDAVVGQQRDSTILGASALISASRSEGMPLVVLEALALGCPILATPKTNVGALLDQGVGLPIGPSPEEIADGLRRFYSMDDDLYALMRSAAQTAISRGFLWSDVGARMADLYRELLAQ